MAINTVSNIMIGRFPIIEYGNIVWGPMYIDQKKKLRGFKGESPDLFQQSEVCQLPYQEKLQKLKLPSLVYRRRRGDMLTDWLTHHNITTS